MLKSNAPVPSFDASLKHCCVLAKAHTSLVKSRNSFGEARNVNCQFGRGTSSFG